MLEKRTVWSVEDGALVIENVEVDEDGRIVRKLDGGLRFDQETIMEELLHDISEFKITNDRSLLYEWLDLRDSLSDLVQTIDNHVEMNLKESF